MKPLKFALAAIAALIVFVALPTSGFAAPGDVYAVPGVADVGIGDDDCSSAANACAIGPAIQGASDGDTIHLAGGSYSDHGYLNVRASIVGPTVGTPAVFVRPLVVDVPAAASNLVFSDFTIDYSDTGSSITSAFTLINGSGSNPAGSITLDRIKVFSEGTSAGYSLAIDLRNGDVTVRNSLFASKSLLPESLGALGINAQAHADGTAELTLLNNTVYADASAGGNANAFGIVPDNSGASPCVMPGATVRNSIFMTRTNSTGAPAFAYDVLMGNVGDMQPCQPKLNMFNSNWRTSPFSSLLHMTTTGDQTAYPTFVNAAARDFHEADGSPTIDAGVADPSLGSLDLDGNPRTLGSAPDIGAFERSNPPMPPAPTPKDATPPGVSGLKFSKSKFAATKKAKKQVKVGFTLTEPATVTWTIAKQVTGRKSGRTCSRFAKKGTRCTYYKSLAGKITADGVLGTNSFKFGGYIGRTKLKSGNYKLTGTAVDAAGNESTAISGRFTITR